MARLTLLSRLFFSAALIWPAAGICADASKGVVTPAPAARPVTPPPPAPAVPVQGTVSKPGTPDARLAYAAAVGTPREIQKLLENEKPNPAATNSEGIPSLSLAAMRTDDKAEEVMDILVKSGVHIDVVDANGQSPLFYAAKRGNEKTVQWLLEHGAQYYLKDNSANIARTYAHREGHDNIVTLMDEFVSGQTRKILAAYEERNRQIAQAQAQQQSTLQQEQQKLAQQQAALKAQAEKAKEQEKAEAEALPPQKPQPVDRIQLQRLVQDLSYNACAEIYWKFVRDQNMESELGENLRSTIEAHQVLRSQIQQQLLSMRASMGYVNAIIAPSQKQLLEQFTPYINNASRHAQGIGTRADVKARCEDISQRWEVTDQNLSRPARRK